MGGLANGCPKTAEVAGCPPMPPSLSGCKTSGPLVVTGISILGRTFTRLTRISLVTRVWRRFFGALFGLKHRKISKKNLQRGPFFFSLRESPVARNSGDSPFWASAWPLTLCLQECSGHRSSKKGSQWVSQGWRWSKSWNRYSSVLVLFFVWFAFFYHVSFLFDLLVPREFGVWRFEDVAELLLQEAGVILIPEQ